MDLGGVKENRQKRNLDYSFTKNGLDLTERSILATGGINNTIQEIAFTEQEIASGSRWKDLSDSGVLIKFNFATDGSVVPDDYDAEIAVNLPFEFDAQHVLEDLISTEGLIDFMYLIGYDHPELLQKFLSDDRKDRKLLSILITYGISVKKKVS